MRIAVSGTHAAGKSTLVAELSALLPDHAVVDEPYHLLAEDGHEFAESAPAGAREDPPLRAELPAPPPDPAVVDEPYHLLVEDGHEFAEMPSVDDFELQLGRSIEGVGDAGPDALPDWR